MISIAPKSPCVSTLLIINSYLIKNSLEKRTFQSRSNSRLNPEALAPWEMVQIDEETGNPRLAKEWLPKILISDPVVQVIKETAEARDNAQLAADPDHKPLAAGWIADPY